MPGLAGEIWMTASKKAFRSGGKPDSKVFSAWTPPADVPMTMTRTGFSGRTNLTSSNPADLYAFHALQLQRPWRSLFHVPHRLAVAQRARAYLSPRLICTFPYTIFHSRDEQKHLSIEFPAKGLLQGTRRKEGSSSFPLVPRPRALGMTQRPMARQISQGSSLDGHVILIVQRIWVVARALRTAFETRRSRLAGPDLPLRCCIGG